jgi:pyruvate/2-oxoglutarate dehydrogenase complex dihydrolipoamide acyltransferase (E2) component
MTEVVFPELSSSDPNAEGVLATWFVADDEQVAEGGLIAEVAVDKVDMEITAPASGRIQLVVKEGEVAGQGTVIARID